MYSTVSKGAFVPLDLGTACPDGTLFPHAADCGAEAHYFISHT